MDNGAYQRYQYQQQQARIKANTEAAKQRIAEKEKAAPTPAVVNNAGRDGYDEAGNPYPVKEKAKAEDAVVQIEEVQQEKVEEETRVSSQSEARQEEQARSDNDDSSAEQARLARKDKEIEQATTIAPAKIVPLEFDPRPNPLFDYADYTYNLSLHVVPPAKYNDIMQVADYVYTPIWNGGTGDTSRPGANTAQDPAQRAAAGQNTLKNAPVGTVLIASGGRRGTNFERNPAFNEDFFFENFTMTTVVGLSSRSKNTNVIDVNFTLVEPYGVTLLDRLLEVTRQIGAKSWHQIPYLLQIDFNGNTEAGDLMSPILNQTKYIPIKIISCKVKVTPKGAEYQIQAIPFNQQAFRESNASTPAIFEVQATTINDFFSSAGNAGQASNLVDVQNVDKNRVDGLMKEVKQEKEKGSGQKPGEAASPGSVGYARPDDKRIADLQKQAEAVSADNAKTPYIVGSYAAAMNSYQQQLVSNGNQNHPETYIFDFHPDIGTSKIVMPETTTTSRTSMSDPVKALRAKAGVSDAGIDLNKAGFSINAGTNIIEVINMVMRSSEYIRNQIVDPATDSTKTASATKEDDANNPMSWYKVTSTVTLGDFDLVRDVYSKKITYHIMPTAMYNSKFPHAPQAQPKSVSKEYNYLYSGKNQSILNFDLDFNSMFFTAVTADRSKLQKTVVQRTQPDSEKSTIIPDLTNVKITNRQIKLISGHADIVNPANPDSKSVLVNDFYQNALSSSRGDMVNVKLKILGDPEFIKQDDIFFNPRTNPDQNTNQHIDKNGSILFDQAERFALLTFETPVDIDPESGLMVKDTKYQTSSFSGIYKIITIENTFTGGVFTQLLDLVRIFDNFTQPGRNERAAPLKTIADTKEAAVIAQDEVDASANNVVSPENTTKEDPADKPASEDTGVAAQDAPPTPPENTALPNPVTDPVGYKKEINRRLTEKFSAEKASQIADAAALKEKLKNAPTVAIGGTLTDDGMIFGPGGL